MRDPQPARRPRPAAAWPCSSTGADPRRGSRFSEPIAARGALAVLAFALLVMATGVARAQSRDTTVKPRPGMTAPADSSVPACCRIVRLDSTSTIVTARETATGFTFQFQVKDPQVRLSLKVGDSVWADFASNVVRLNTLDGEPCCPIVKNGRPPGSSAPAAPPNRR